MNKKDSNKQRPIIDEFVKEINEILVSAQKEFTETSAAACGMTID